MSRDGTLYASMRGGGQAVSGAVDVSLPVAGFYRSKLRGQGVYVGIRIWFGAPHDPVTGEELDRSWRWQAQANGEAVEFDAVWPVCGDEPITPEEYRTYCQRQSWAQQNAPQSAFADPRKRHDPLTALLPF